MSMLKAVFEGLLGISMDEHVKKTVPLSSRKNGIFGRARAASLSFECQGRGTLHGHCLAWVELTPQVLQRLAGRTIFSDQISSILDTMIISSLEVSDHITSALSDNRPHVNVWRKDCNPVEDPVEYEKYITSNMTATQIHSHSDTCKKGNHGTKSSPYTHYLYRGNQLRNMNFVEYYSIMKIVKIPPGQVDDGTTTTTRRGRQSNKTFLFNEPHPLVRLYRQQIRSKQATPILASYPPPTYPGDMTVPSTRLLRNEWKRFATYYLTAFCPWNIDTGKIPYAFNFRGFSDFVQTMATRHTFLDRARMFFLESTIRVLRLKQKNLIAITHYRFSNADRRIGNRFEGPCISDRNNSDLNNDNGEEDQDLARLLERIRAEALQDDISELTEMPGELNAICVCDALRSVMGENVINTDIDQSTEENVSSTSQENNVFVMTNNQALNVLNSLRLNPTAPAQELPPAIQQARAVEGLNLPITQLESEVHVPPGELNKKNNWSLLLTLLGIFTKSSVLRELESLL